MDRDHEPPKHGAPAAAKPSAPAPRGRTPDDAARVLAAREAQRAATGASRLTPLVPVDLGTIFLGASRVVEIPAPMNLGAVPATVSVAVAGDGTLAGHPVARNLPVATLAPVQLAHHLEHPIRIRVAPRRPGEQVVHVTYRAAFDDGREEASSIVLRGYARSIDAAPGPSPEAVAAADAESARAAAAHEVEERRFQKDKRIGAYYHPGEERQLLTASREAEIHMDALAHAQRDGVNDLQAEAEMYTRPTPPRSVWWALAEIAVTLGVAGVAGLVGKTVASRIGAWAMRLPAADDAVKSSKLLLGVGDALKDGLKLAGKKAFAAVQPLPRAGSHRIAPARPFSSDGLIAFFGAQRDALTNFATEGKLALLERHRYLGPLLRTEPARAVQGMRDLAAGLEAARPSAHPIQAHATATQWAALVATSTLGREEARALDGSTSETTRLDLARSDHDDGPPASRDGLLDITVDHHRHNRVVAARITGVSRAVADRLAQLPLADMQLPVRVIVGDQLASPAVITRDEAGRVRVAGNLALIPGERDQAHGLTEATVIHAATALLARILGQPLAVEVTTDDASERTR